MDLDDRLRDASRALASSIHPTGHLADLDRRASRTKRRRVGVASTIVVVVMGFGVFAGVRDGAVEVAANGDTVAVVYERVEYRQTAQLSCEGTELREPDTFDHATFETWADADGRRWRSRVTYPDGSTRDVIAEGSPWYPTELYTRGELRGAVLGCDDPLVGVLVAEPGQSSLYSLNPLADAPVLDSGEPAVPTYADLGTQVPGEHTDSRGRPADLWRQVITGFLGDTGVDRRPVTQTTDWFVDADTGEIMESRYENAVDSIGVAHSRATRVETSSMHAPPELFDPTGYERVAIEVEPRPVNENGATAAPLTPVRSVPDVTAPQPAADQPLNEGDNAVYLISVDLDAMTATVDVIEWLSGEEAAAAYQEQTGETDGPPNDYMIRNDSDQLRTVPLHAPEVTVAWDENGPTERRIDLDELPAYLEQRRALGDAQPTFWVSVEDGQAVRLDEQYRP